MFDNQKQVDLKVVAATLLYSVCAVVLSLSHEPWRDEAVTLSMVRESRSIAELWAQLKYYGHPGLWHTLIYSAHQIFPFPEVLKLVNLFICISAIYLFLKKAPFGWAQKLLFITGFFPLYLYPVFSRNYGISMLLMFAVCALYKDRWKHPVLLGLTLCLLANAHIHSLIIACAIGAALAFERLVLKPRHEFIVGKRDPLVIILAGLAFGVALCMLQVFPAADAIMLKTDRLTVIGLLKAAIKAVIMPGMYIYGLFGLNSPHFVNAVIFVMYIHLWRNKNLLILFATGIIGLNIFFGVLFPSNDMRHQGAFYLLMVMVLWLDVEKRKTSMPQEDNERAGKRWALIGKTIVTVLLIIQTGMAGRAITEEWTKPYSSAQSLAAMVSQDPTLKNAIILGIPDSLLETLPYYLENQLYFFSEERFGKYRTLNKRGRMGYHLTDVLNMSRDLHARYGRPVVILLGTKVNERRPQTFKINYQKTFTFSADELKEFYGHVTLLADFNAAISDENYRVYLLNT